MYADRRCRYRSVTSQFCLIVAMQRAEYYARNCPDLPACLYEDLPAQHFLEDQLCMNSKVFGSFCFLTNGRRSTSFLALSEPHKQDLLVQLATGGSTPSKLRARVKDIHSELKGKFRVETLSAVAAQSTIAELMVNLGGEIAECEMQMSECNRIELEETLEKAKGVLFTVVATKRERDVYETKLNGVNGRLKRAEVALSSSEKLIQLHTSSEFPLKWSETYWSCQLPP